MDNRILRKALDELEARRTQNLQEEKRRRELLSRDHPQLLLLEAKRHEAIRLSARAVLTGSAAGVSDQIDALTRQLKAELAEANLPEDYLSNVYVCPRCCDEGYYYDSRNMRVTCSCVLKRCAQIEEEMGLVPQDFAHFDETVFPESVPCDNPKLPVIPQRAAMRLLKAKCEAYAAQLPDGFTQNLLLQGESGLGKTFLLHCVENAAKEKGMQTLCVTAYDWFNDQRKQYFSNSDERSVYYTVPLLLIDDLGTEPLMEGLTVEFFQHLISSRLTEGKYTVLSTNLNKEELRKRYTERVTSRLYDQHTAMALIFAGKDIRLK